MPNNTVITMDDLTAYTTKLKSILDTNYSGSGSSGSSGSGSSGSTRVDSGKTKLSELVDLESMNQDCSPFEMDNTGTGFIDASNNKDCGALYKEGNKCHFEIYGGLQLTVAANQTISGYDNASMDYGISVLKLPSGFIPDKGGHYGSAKLIRIPDTTHNEIWTSDEPIPVIIYIDRYDSPTEAYIRARFTDFSLINNSKNYAVKYNLIIDYNYMLES